MTKDQLQKLLVDTYNKVYKCEYDFEKRDNFCNGAKRTLETAWEVYITTEGTEEDKLKAVAARAKEMYLGFCTCPQCQSTPQVFLDLANANETT